MKFKIFIAFAITFAQRMVAMEQYSSQLVRNQFPLLNNQLTELNLSNVKKTNNHSNPFQICIRITENNADHESKNRVSRILYGEHIFKTLCASTVTITQQDDEIHQIEIDLSSFGYEIYKDNRKEIKSELETSIENKLREKQSIMQRHPKKCLIGAFGIGLAVGIYLNFWKTLISYVPK